jgi:hypothetical protein
MFTVYADYSGHIGDPADNLILYSTLIVNDQIIADINEHQLQLIEKLKDWDLEIDSKFEFHTKDIINKTGMWRHIPKEKIIHILTNIKKIFIDFKIPAVVLVVDKAEGGLGAIKKLNKMANEGITKEIKNEIRELLKEVAPEINIERLKGDQLSILVGMLIGLTNGLMNYYMMNEKAKVVLDEQFVKQTDLWRGILILTKASWQSLVKSGVFFTWPSDKELQWYISDEIMEVKSYESFGVQLADYAAYTTRSIKLRDLEEYKRFSVLKNHRLVKIDEGFYAGLNY